MTVIMAWLVMIGAEIPVFIFLVTIVCDTILLSVGMITGIIHFGPHP